MQASHHDTLSPSRHQNTGLEFLAGQSKLENQKDIRIATFIFAINNKNMSNEYQKTQQNKQCTETH